MLTALLLLGVLGGEVDVGSGPIIAPPASTVAALSVPSSGAIGNDIPLGAYQWARPLDPADRAPYAFSFAALLATGEEIADIVRLTVSAAGAALGLEIDTSLGRVPIISDDGTTVQLWFCVADAFQENVAFSGAGVRIPIAFLVETNSSPFKRYERTAVLTVRQQ